jgi:hypothetical protein
VSRGKPFIMTLVRCSRAALDLSALAFSVRVWMESRTEGLRGCLGGIARRVGDRCDACVAR